MSTLIKPMTYGYEGQDDGFAYTSLLLSLCQELCLGCSVGDLVDGSLFPIFPKKKVEKWDFIWSSGGVCSTRGVEITCFKPLTGVLASYLTLI